MSRRPNQIWPVVRRPRSIARPVDAADTCRSSARVCSMSRAGLRVTSAYLPSHKQARAQNSVKSCHRETPQFARHFSGCDDRELTQACYSNSRLTENSLRVNVSVAEPVHDPFGVGVSSRCNDGYSAVDDTLNCLLQLGRIIYHQRQ